MTDETKGDGMTLEQVRDTLREWPGLVFSNGHDAEDLADAIEAHLAAQSAMRVDEEAEFRNWFNGEQGKAYDGMWCFARAAWMHRAALQAAIGGNSNG